MKRFMNPNGIQDVIHQMTVLLNQLVQQLAEKDPTRTLVSVATAVSHAKQDGSSAALLQEIFENSFPGQPLPTVLDPATFEALQKSQEAQKP